MLQSIDTKLYRLYPFPPIFFTFGNKTKSLKTPQVDAELEKCNITSPAETLFPSPSPLSNTEASLA